MMQDIIKGANGILFINDPHLGSRRPGRRNDDDYAQTILGKIAECIEIANRQRLIPVFGGDLFHRPRETGPEGEAVKTKLIRILSESWIIPFANVGNHDINGSEISDSDSLSVIAESGRVLRIAKETGPLFEYDDEGVTIGVGAVPVKHPIPNDVCEWFPNAKATILISHHDVAVDVAWPGAIIPFEVRGCSMLWNAHIHNFKGQIIAGETKWVNYGAITRTTIACANEKPAAWEYSWAGGLSPHYLKFREDAFDYGARLVDEILPDFSMGTSAFVESIVKNLGDSVHKTDDGIILHDLIKSRFEEEGTDENVKNAIMNYFNTIAGPCH